jgi:hypothetical protein
MPALPPGASTVLVITGVGLTPYSARGLQQTLEPAAIGVNTRRTVNGKLINLAPPQFQKYKSRITGDDQLPPALDGIFPGQSVIVDCLAELAIPSGAAATRPTVAGSVRVEGAWTYYRPRLAMIIIGFSTNYDEWGAKVGWSLDLEEI